MSAGDVLFVGWTGGDPQYKELAPQIQIEPSSVAGNVVKRITINRVCFDKDKNAVIQTLPVDGAFLSSNVISEAGEVETISLGGGYRLISVSDSQYAVGFSRISAVYSKEAASAFEVGLPEGMSITCENGIGKIKYLTHVLEEYDSESGVCDEGLELIKVEDRIPYVPDMFAEPITIPLRFDNTKTNPVTQYGVNGIWKIAQQDVIALHYQIRINGIAAEDIYIKNSELGAGSVNDQVDYRRSILNEGTKFDNDPPVNITNEELDEIAASAYENYFEAISEDAKTQASEPVGTEWTTFRYRIDDGGITSELYYNIWSKLRFRYTDTRSINFSRVYPRWEKSGNIIRLMIATKPIKEYDITGLT